MRYNTGDPSRISAKHAAPYVAGVVVGWRPKPYRGRMPRSECKAKPVKIPRPIMSEIIVDPNWVCFKAERPPLGKRSAVRKPKPKKIKLTNAEKFAAGIMPDPRWLKRMGLEYAAAN